MTTRTGSSVERPALRMVIFRAVTSAIVAASGTALLPGAATAQQVGCPSRFAGHSVVGSAAGMQIVEEARGVTIAETADGSLPAAQATVDSQFGSLGFAGAPYSDTVSGNVGQADATPNDIPNFAVSYFPAEPHEVEKSLPAANLSTASDPTSSVAMVEAGGASATADGNASESASASARCDETSLEAAAENTAESLMIADVLSIGAVRSTASSRLDADGTTTLEASIEVEGATVAGQSVEITEEGVVLAGNVIPVPGNPAADALAAEGVSVTYIGERRNEETGEITAPGLQIVVAQRLPVGTTPATTTFVVGQAYARASVSRLSVDPPPPATTQVTTTPPSGASRPTSPSGAVAAAPPSVGGTVAAQPTVPGAVIPELATTRIASWSILPAFSALALGSFLFTGAWVVLGKLTARFRWT